MNANSTRNKINIIMLFMTCYTVLCILYSRWSSRELLSSQDKMIKTFHNFSYCYCYLLSYLFIVDLYNLSVNQMQKKKTNLISGKLALHSGHQRNSALSLSVSLQSYSIHVLIAHHNH